MLPNVGISGSFQEMSDVLSEKSGETETMSPVERNGQYNVCFQGASFDAGNRGCRALAAAAFAGGVFILNRNNKPSGIKRGSGDKLNNLSSAEVKSV